MQTIGVIASCIMDLSYEIENFPAPGQTITTDNFHTGFGGKGANQAVAAAKTGGNVRVIGAVGNDDFGRDTIENFKNYNIDCRFIKQIKNEGTGLACIIVDKNGENQIAVAGRANRKLTLKDIEKIPLEWFEVDFLGGVLELNEPVLVRAFEQAKEVNSATTVLNAAPSRTVSDQLWSLTDCLIVNETEAEYYTGIRPTAEDYSNALSKLREMGPDRIILTLGAKGAVLFDDRDQTLIEGVPVDDVVDTTGAGDAFIGRYLSARADNLVPTDAIDEANRYASLSVQYPGTQKSYPDHRP